MAMPNKVMVNFKFLKKVDLTCGLFGSQYFIMECLAPTCECHFSTEQCIVQMQNDIANLESQSTRCNPNLKEVSHTANKEISYSRNLSWIAYKLEGCMGSQGVERRFGCHRRTFY